MSAAVMTTAVASPLNVSAGQLLYETHFDYKMIPWHTCESAPAKQTFSIEDGAAHIAVISPSGAAKEKWDLQFRYRGLDFVAGHKYEVSFTVKALREGMELDTHIGNLAGDQEYFVIDGDEMHNGAAMDGNWGSPMQLSNLSKKITGTFIPTKDINNAEWTFQYAKGTNYAGNAEAGDEIWFEEMSIKDLSWDDGPDDPPTEHEMYGYVSRNDSGTENNYISVNQLGYYKNLEKVATLSDNSGDMTHEPSTIDIGTELLRFDVINAKTGKSVYNGITQPVTGIDKDSGDNVHKIDFTEYNKQGRYYLKVGSWRSMEFNIGTDIYDKNMLSNALNFFYLNRANTDIPPEYITSGDKPLLAHAASEKDDECYVQSSWVGSYRSVDEAQTTYGSSTIECNGGWFDSDDYTYHGKSVVKGGNTLWTLMNMYERASQSKEGKKKFDDGSGTVVVPEGENGIPDILDECMYELDFMKKMVVQKDEPTWGDYAGLVYHRVKDYKWTGIATRPWDYISEYQMTRVVQPPTFAATLNFAACAAQAARLLKPYAPEKADEYLEAAKASFEAFKTNYYQYLNQEDVNARSLYAPTYGPMSSEPDGDTDVNDEMYWAACELLAATGDKEYYDLITESDLRKIAFEIPTSIESSTTHSYYSSWSDGSGINSSIDTTNMSAAGSLTLLLNKDKLEGKLSAEDIEKLNDSLVKAADRYLELENDQGYGIPYYTDISYTEPTGLPNDIVIKGYQQGSNKRVVNNAIIMAYAYDVTRDRKYIDGTATAMDYLLGRNPLSYSYVTGCGDYAVENPFHDYWANGVDQTFPKAPSGVLTSGPNAFLSDEYVHALGFIAGKIDNYSQRCYVDNNSSWSTNSTSINQNAPLAWVISFMQDEVYGPHTDPEEPTEPVTTTTEPVKTTKVTNSTEPVKTAKTTAAKPSETTKTTKATSDKTTETTEPSQSTDHTPITGDIDNNGYVELADITKLAKHILNPVSYPLGKGAEAMKNILKFADLNGDSAVNTLDLSALIEINLGKNKNK